MKSDTSLKKFKDMKNAGWPATTAWYRHDIYQYEEKVSRWSLLRWLIRGTFKVLWTAPADRKDKRLHLKGKKIY